jgi:polyribonucleotide nucleotidyltransferase
VVSNKLISLMLAQASENPYISAIFEDLLDESGSEICLRPITDYVSIDAPVNFYTILEAAKLRGKLKVYGKIDEAKEKVKKVFADRLLSNEVPKGQLNQAFEEVLKKYFRGIVLGEGRRPEGAAVHVRWR